jgi:hypothetical protein
MKKALILFAILGAFSGHLFGQTRKKTPTKTPKKITQPQTVKPLEKDGITLAQEMGGVSGKTYRNTFFGFEIEFPFTWLVPDKDFEAVMKKQGFNLEVQTPKATTPANQIKLNLAVKNVANLVTAYKLMPGSADNSIFRISVEDLDSQPKAKDAVDYLDLMTESFKAIKLPPDFVYSEVKAEQLGKEKFAYMDSSSKSGKKRMYVTVKDRFAILFTFAYSSDEDLETMRNVLAEGDFSLKSDKLIQD